MKTTSETKLWSQKLTERNAGSPISTLVQGPILSKLSHTCQWDNGILIKVGAIYFFLNLVYLADSNYMYLSWKYFSQCKSFTSTELTSMYVKCNKLTSNEYDVSFTPDCSSLPYTSNSSRSSVKDINKHK